MSVKIQDFAAFGLDDSIMRAIDEMGYAIASGIIKVLDEYK